MKFILYRSYVSVYNKSHLITLRLIIKTNIYDHSTMNIFPNELRKSFYGMKFRLLKTHIKYLIKKLFRL